jgi:hypothetical protein
MPSHFAICSSAPAVFGREWLGGDGIGNGDSLEGALEPLQLEGADSEALDGSLSQLGLGTGGRMLGL